MQHKIISNYEEEYNLSRDEILTSLNRRQILVLGRSLNIIYVVQTQQNRGLNTLFIKFQSR